jgi:chemotaxis methyl-accepting protein methylase
VIQHQDPTRPGLLAQLLQRHSRMPVVAARQRTRIRPGRVYVMPPDKEMSILHGSLYLLAETARRTVDQPIDHLFQALAADCREFAVGVVLSGMGSDGTLGLRAIKEQAGLALAQEPATAGFAAMPQSVIDADLADIVVAPEEMPARIADFFRSAGRHPAMSGRKPQSALEGIIILLRERTGNDFSLYKKSALYRRIERRMALHQLASIADYGHFLRDNDVELDALFNELLIGVTRFFRDPGAWDALIDTALPALFGVHPEGGELRAWVPACSTGEEAYTLGIAFREALARSRPMGHFSLRIFATDLDESAVEQARSGSYPDNIAADLTPQRLAAWFSAEPNGYRLKTEIRDMVIFARQNVIADPPFNRLDILSCRNLLIYLAPEVQERLLPMFHFALNHHGILMLGTAEGIGRFGSLFSVLDLQQRLFQRHLPFTEPPAPGTPPGSATAVQAAVQETLAIDIELARTRQALLEARDEEQAVREELRSSQEELQSTLEELWTAKQELQSLYEELQSTNLELQARQTAQTRLASDLDNLLDCSQAVSVLLDARLNVRRFSPNAAHLFKLLPVDIGRPLADIVSLLDYPGLIAAAREVMRTLVVAESSRPSQDGRQYRVCIAPCRDRTGILTGVVISCTDITEAESWRAALTRLGQALGDDLPGLAEAPQGITAMQQQLREVRQLLRRLAPNSPSAVERLRLHEQRSRDEKSQGQ